MGIEKSCLNSSYFHCNQSLKCIPYHRVADGMVDCYHSEDEQFNACQLNESTRFTCPSDPNKCLSLVALGNIFSDCPLEEDKAYKYKISVGKLVPFSTLCDKHNDYNSHSTNVSETDESNCQWWPCNNPYTSCDGVWHCLDGLDELNCPDNKCSLGELMCYSITNILPYCLPYVQLFDRYLNSCHSFTRRQIGFYNGTEDISNNYLSWKNTSCVTLTKICQTHSFSSSLTIQPDVCAIEHHEAKWMNTLGVEPVMKNTIKSCFFRKRTITSMPKHLFLTSKRFGYFPPPPNNLPLRVISEENRKRTIIQKIDDISAPHCNRGIAVLNIFNITPVCFCAPNYFGSRCQWQNQRISLTLQFLWRYIASTDVLFQVIIMLINQSGSIAPNYEQVTYVPSRDCNTKFNIYLLYPDRPKNLSNNYSIRIDIFEKINLIYWASWHLPIPFSFLPVNRISNKIIIFNKQETISCSLSCGQQGQCMKYANNKSLIFCRCNQGYSGARCEISHKCNCSNDSFCLSPFICVCPLHKFGTHCYLKQSICKLSINPCRNNGICIPTDDRINLTGFTCFCRQGYSGPTCENTNNRIGIYLPDAIIEQNKLVLIHFIAAFEDAEHERITLLKKIPYNHSDITVDMPQPFNILFVEMSNKKYYLGILRERFIVSEHIKTTIQQKQQCLSISTLLNSTVVNSTYLHRTKYYPIVCRQHQNLTCFYDVDLLCICDLDRFSNCFFFNHTMNYDCKGYNYCENGGRCFQNNETCPTKFICMCPDCYYGTKCQYSTTGFLLSLDYILGYHIKPHISFNRQPLIVKLSTAFITVMFSIGLINGVVSIITFRIKTTQDVGCGFYLFISSCISMIIAILLVTKFLQLVLSQMSIITNRLVLNLNCLLLDMTLRVSLATNDWLDACVFVERIFTIMKGAKFSKTKSKRIAKWVVLCVILLTTITHLHIPLHHRLADDVDVEEQRTWCLAQYSTSVNILSSFITLTHFLIPFAINALSVLFINIYIARSRSISQPRFSFRTHLKLQFKQNKHHQIASSVLVLLALPRVIISFATGCMKSPRSSWGYIFSYLITFLPSMMTFLIYILPSKTYKDAFLVATRRKLNAVRMRINN
ncbi:unnamed protein product [Rotaria sp. Silwood2]|nr:unnamed protein product [Rotaria sp. Silwood2]CAF2958392.1 unnamed protein product [Rotaria sp. Silwood2]